MNRSSAEFSQRAMRLRPSAIRAMAAQASLPGVVSFAAGAPNVGQFPYDPIKTALSDIMADRAQFAQAQQYGASEGFLPLREFLASHLSRDDSGVEVDEILITSGSQQALEFIGKLFIDAGDRILTTGPTYIGALQAFGLCSPEVVGIPLDGCRIDLARLEQEFAKGARFFYVMPDSGNPTGTSLPLDQRHEILRLARHYAVPVIEDQAYDQLNLSDAPPSPDASGTGSARGLRRPCRYLSWHLFEVADAGPAGGLDRGAQSADGEARFAHASLGSKFRNAQSDDGESGCTRGANHSRFNVAQLLRPSAQRDAVGA